jgi:hypothetical protein
VSTAVSNITDLEVRIAALEKKQASQMAELKSTAVNIVESFSPSNMLRGALKDVVGSPDLRRSAINTAIGIGAGLVGKKIYVGNSGSIFKKITGSALEFLIANFVRKKIPEMQEKQAWQQGED